METTIKSNNIDFTNNYEVIRDFCGSCYSFVEEQDPQMRSMKEELYLLPEAVHALAQWYHWGGYVGLMETYSGTDLIETILTERNAIPLDSDTWGNADTVREVYTTLLNDGSALSIGLRYAITKGIMKSDGYRAYMYCQEEVRDWEIAKILMKALRKADVPRVLVTRKHFEDLAHIQAEYWASAETRKVLETIRSRSTPSVLY